jgi:hypothetical protein
MVCLLPLIQTWMEEEHADRREAATASASARTASPAFSESGDAAAFIIVLLPSPAD